MSKRTELWVSTGTQSEYNVSVGYKEENILIREETKEVFFYNDVLSYIYC